MAAGLSGNWISAWIKQCPEPAKTLPESCSWFVPFSLYFSSERDFITRPAFLLFANSSAPATFPYNRFIVTPLLTTKEWLGLECRMGKELPLCKNQEKQEKCGALQSHFSCLSALPKGCTIKIPRSIIILQLVLSRGKNKEIQALLSLRGKKKKV